MEGKNETTIAGERTQRADRTPRPKAMDIHVTKEVLDGSKVRSSSHCMVAEAVKEHCKEKGIKCGAVSVDIQTIRFSDKARRLRYVYLTPYSVQRAIIQFDQGIMPDPFSFRLRGGQVTRSKRTTPAKSEYMKKYNLGKGRKIKTTDTANPTGYAPIIVGGKEPPTTSVGRIRRFGLQSIPA